VFTVAHRLGLFADQRQYSGGKRIDPFAVPLGEREQRYRKHGASPYIGEPNVKESAGGLRDMHTAALSASTIAML